MAIENIPVWPFEPNWSSTLTETLEWLTDIMTSPSGSEQRRSLRYFPRRTFEYTIAAEGSERSLLDNLLTAFGAQHWYLPLWHDVNFTEIPIAISGLRIVCSTVHTSKILPNSIALLMGDSPYDVELVDISAIADEEIILRTPVSRFWPAGTHLYPVRVAKLTDQPELSKRHDDLVTSEVRFQVVEANRAADIISPIGLTDIYQGRIVLSIPPDDRSTLNSGVERLLVELDNQTSLPVWRDTAAKPFTYEQYAWVIEGRAELSRFENLMQALRGRSQPIWVPTFMQDMVLAADVEDGDETILVEKCGFTLAGGPRADRQDIMIETLTERIYRRITASAFNSQGQEVLALDTPISSALSGQNVVRICFMTLMRMNQDSISIEHQTDSDGVATALATFRSAPNTRVPEAASF